jgi:hypothetical protein
VDTRGHSLARDATDGEVAAAAAKIVDGAGPLEKGLSAALVVARAKGCAELPLVSERRSE